LVLLLIATGCGRTRIPHASVDAASCIEAGCPTGFGPGGPNLVSCVVGDGSIATICTAISCDDEQGVRTLCPSPAGALRCDTDSKSCT
jgi:hypothetical protein